MQPTRTSGLRAARTQPAFRRPSARRRCPGARNRWRIDRQAQRSSRARRSTRSPRLSRNTHGWISPFASSSSPVSADLDSARQMAENSLCCRASLGCGCSTHDNRRLAALASARVGIGANTAIFTLMLFYAMVAGAATAGGGRMSRRRPVCEGWVSAAGVKIGVLKSTLKTLKRVQRTGRTGLECCVIDLGVERPMHGFRNQLLVAVMALASSSLVMLAGQQTPAAGRYSGAQAAAGRTVYQMQCSSCHQPDLKGQGEAPPLAGSEFIEAWGRRSPRELLAFMQLTMPPARPGGLSEEEYVNITAFILQSNGAPAGNQALTAATEVAINTVATGQAPTTAPPAQGQRRERHAGARWPHGRSDLGKPVWLERERRRHAWHCDSWRQTVCGDQRGAPDRARRENRQDRMANDDRRSIQGQLRHQQRPDRGQG